MKRDEIKQLLLQMWDDSNKRCIGTAESEMDFIENITDLILDIL